MDRRGSGKGSTSRTSCPIVPNRDRSGAASGCVVPPSLDDPAPQASRRNSLDQRTAYYARLASKDTVKYGESVCDQSSDQNATRTGNPNSLQTKHERTNIGHKFINIKSIERMAPSARVAELADALDLGSRG